MQLTKGGLAAKDPSHKEAESGAEQGTREHTNCAIGRKTSPSCNAATTGVGSEAQFTGFGDKSPRGQGLQIIS